MVAQDVYYPVTQIEEAGHTSRLPIFRVTDISPGADGRDGYDITTQIPAEFRSNMVAGPYFLVPQFVDEQRFCVLNGEIRATRTAGSKTLEVTENKDLLREGDLVYLTGESTYPFRIFALDGNGNATLSRAPKFSGDAILYNTMAQLDGCLATSTAQRPTYHNNVGRMAFDTTLNKPIWINADGYWVDGYGNLV